MLKIFIYLLVTASVFLSSSASHALKNIYFNTEGENALVNISKKDLNLIKFPVDDVRTYTKSKNLEVKVNGKNIVVSYTGHEEENAEVATLLFTTPGGAYSMLLRPTDIPSETVMVHLPRLQIASGEEGEPPEGDGLCRTGHSYTQSIKELIKAIYTGANNLSGYSVQKISRDYSPRWPGTKEIQVLAYKGLLMDGEKYRIVNQSGQQIELRENDFHQKGILAVSIEKHTLEPNEETSLFVVKRSPRAPGFN